MTSDKLKVAADLPLATSCLPLFSNGFLILDKPVGMSSAKVVAEVKRIVKCKKIGHGGTLDPLASGVLPLAINEATKAFDYVASSTKQYRFTLRFGEERSTDDAEGEVTATTDILPTREAIEAVLPLFAGSIVQTPPIYSALKINGERAYKLARAGEQVEMTPRKVDIYSCELQVTSCKDFSPVTRNVQQATFLVTCGKGTYVRSLARDIARKVSSLGYVSLLRRTAVGKFTEANAISLEKCSELVHSGALFKAWVSLELALDDIPAIRLDTQQATRIRQGQVVPITMEDGRYLATDSGKALALCRVENGSLYSVRVFNTN